MRQRNQMFEVHVSTSSVCKNDGRMNSFSGGRETQGSIQTLCPQRNLHCVLKVSEQSVSEHWGLLAGLNMQGVKFLSNENKYCHESNEVQMIVYGKKALKLFCTLP